MERIFVQRIQRILRSLAFWAGATRAAFSSASMVPVVLGGAVSAAHGTFAVGPFLLSAAGVLALHLGANLVNDYYDYASGADVIRDSRTPFYGGGTILVEGTLSPRQVSRAYRILFAVAFLIGLVLATSRGLGVLALGLGGFLCGYFYTAPPLRLSYVGLGEATIGLCFGPLTVAGVYFAQAGRLGAEALEALVASIPVGLLVAAIVFVNEFPDRAADGAAGKRTLVVRLPLRTALTGYSALVLAPFAIVAAAILLGLLPPAAALAYLALPLAALGIRNLRAAHSIPAPRLGPDTCGSPGGLEDRGSSCGLCGPRRACGPAHFIRPNGPVDPGAPGTLGARQVPTVCGGYLAPRQVAASISTILLHLAVGLLLSLGFTLHSLR
ncbi:MAG: prenyltransferase [Firmicutes bacterium]|nr:prenyltransferase [Bacillota bacterium]